MQYIYQQVLQRLLEHLSQAQRASLQLLIQRLIVAAGGIERIAGFKLMAAHDGSQTSSHALACLRAAQLSIAARSPGTFQLRIAVVRQPGMSTTALRNIEQSFSALFLHDDPRIELLMLNDQQLRTFDSRHSASASQQQAERNELLLFGHLLAGLPRAGFGSHGYLRLAELCRQALGWRGGIDALISAQPLSERRRYLAWSRRALREEDLLSIRPIHSCAASLCAGMSELRQRYLEQLFGQTRTVTSALADDYCAPAMRFITIDDLVHDPDVPHDERLNRFLGCRFDEQYFAGDRSGTANPLLLAHLSGLHAQFIEDSEYREGVDAYLRRARLQMQSHGLPRAVQNRSLGRWQSSEQVQQRRAQANDVASQAYGLSEAQLVCKLFAPFVSRGLRLEVFLRRCHPGMLVALPYMHKALQQLPAPEPVVQWMLDISGLSLPLLQMLYQREPQACARPRSLLAQIQRRGADLRQLRLPATAWAWLKAGQPGTRK
ncbi:hypothetical protein EXN22_13240 [Pseudomonas tructae]|uniref:Uncharacterized protein n=1 Tax=Pseudomonas tructae TaxID=2518644 RepID=A0A411MIU4_9PSED|nr:hypothetical protein [Pseudomonas tructae]QBF26609.1 hypothetical protein EXN22_13240 [Pseudomonas tructae]